jgi:hypothetical protein
MNLRITPGRFLATLCLLFIFSAGCSTLPRPRAYNIEIELDPALATGSNQVDLIGANSADLPKWSSYSMTDYWRADDAKRRDADKVVMRFGQGNRSVQTLLTIDPSWTRWEATGAQYLVVLLQLSGVTTDRDGNADPRRLILPLDRREWARGVTTIELRVQESGIRLMTPRKYRK